MSVHVGVFKVLTRSAASEVEADEGAQEHEQVLGGVLSRGMSLRSPAYIISQSCQLLRIISELFHATFFNIVSFYVSHAPITCYHSSISHASLYQGA